jgi:hypothetical protein
MGKSQIKVQKSQITNNVYAKLKLSDYFLWQRTFCVYAIIPITIGGFTKTETIKLLESEIFRRKVLHCTTCL